MKGWGGAYIKRLCKMKIYFMLIQTLDCIFYSSLMGHFGMSVCTVWYCCRGYTYKMTKKKIKFQVKPVPFLSYYWTWTWYVNISILVIITIMISLVRFYLAKQQLFASLVCLCTMTHQSCPAYLKDSLTAWHSGWTKAPLHRNTKPPSITVQQRWTLT